MKRMHQEQVEDSPFGSTPYLNYNPNEINTVSDAIDYFEWLAERNRDKGERKAASIYEDAADFLSKTLDNDD